MIDYKKEKFQEILSNYDYVFDTQGGKILKDAFKIIKPGGKIVSISGLPNLRFAKEYQLPLWKQVAIAFASRKLTSLEKLADAQYIFLFMKPSGAELSILRTLIEQDKIKPVIDRILPFSEITEAFNYSKTSRAKGKIILKINEVTE